MPSIILINNHDLYTTLMYFGLSLMNDAILSSLSRPGPSTQCGREWMWPRSLDQPLGVRPH